MAKKQKVASPSTNWYSVGIVLSRVLLGAFMIYLGYVLATDAGERVYNTYMHSLRKMLLPKSKPSDSSPLGLTWNDLNKLSIFAMGALSIISGLLIASGHTKPAGAIFAICVAFFAATKDNHWIKSDVAAIKREKN